MDASGSSRELHSPIARSTTSGCSRARWRSPRLRRLVCGLAARQIGGLPEAGCFAPAPGPPSPAGYRPAPPVMPGASLASPAGATNGGGPTTCMPPERAADSRTRAKSTGPAGSPSAPAGSLAPR